MVKCRCFSILMPPPHLHFNVGRDYSNIEIGGRGFDLELVRGLMNATEEKLKNIKQECCVRRKKES